MLMQRTGSGICEAHCRTPHYDMPQGRPDATVIAIFSLGSVDMEWSTLRSLADAKSESARHVEYRAISPLQFRSSIVPKGHSAQRGRGGTAPFASQWQAWITGDRNGQLGVSGDDISRAEGNTGRHGYQHVARMAAIGHR